MTLLDGRLKANGELVADSGRTGKPLVVITGRRPLTGGLSPGAEEALFSMKAGGDADGVVIQGLCCYMKAGGGAAPPTDGTGVYASTARRRRLCSVALGSVCFARSLSLLHILMQRLREGPAGAQRVAHNRIVCSPLCPGGKRRVFVPAAQGFGDRVSSEWQDAMPSGVQHGLYAWHAAVL